MAEERDYNLLSATQQVELLKTDEALKFAHREAWNDIVNAGV